VAGGENLWTIARDHLEEATGGGSEAPTNDQVTAYWAQVKEANQGRLESGDPDLIRAGEKVVLPEVTAASAEPAPETRKKTSQPAARGDSLWTIARDHLAAAGKGSGEPSNRQVAAYWAKVKEANRHRLASGDPDLIEPGEIIVLPPVD
jgi:nucleoid-associated protein YgaU